MDSGKCSKCQQNGGQGEVMVQCIGCQVRNHAKCVKLNPEEAVEKRWRCRNCKHNKHSDQSAPTTRSTQLKEEELNKTMVNAKNEENDEEVASRMKASDIDKLKDQCYDGHKKLKSLERRIKALDDKYDDVLCKNQKLEKELLTYKLKVEDLEQKIRLNTVEVWGIHVSNNDNLIDIIKRLCEVMDWPISKLQIDRVWKVIKSEEEFLVGTLINKMDTTIPKTVICVNFVTNNGKEEFMSKWKSTEQAGGVSLRQLGIDEEGYVKIENSLTSCNQQLFHKALDYANEFHYARVGVRDGEIYILKDLEVGPMIFIKTLTDFEKLADIERKQKNEVVENTYSNRSLEKLQKCE